MGKDSEKEWICVYMYKWITVAHEKLSQYCKSTIFQLNLKKKLAKAIMDNSKK